MKKLIEDLNVFRKYFRGKQDVSDEIQISIYFIKYDIQTYIENNISCKKAKEKLFWLNGDGLKKLLTMNPMKKISQKGTQHQRISHIWLITRNFCVNMKNCTH